jgi:hypothetical protein
MARVRLSSDEIHRRLGVVPGPLLKAWVAEAERLRPEEPEDAFELLWMHLPWIAPGGSADDLRNETPDDVIPFVESSGDLIHFGFLNDDTCDGRDSDSRPIVRVEPGDLAEIVAADLAAFLGVVSKADADIIARASTDRDWRSTRAQAIEASPEDERTLSELERCLLSLPGVSAPASLRAVTKAAKNRRFHLR